MPFICLSRSDIPNGSLQVGDLWPNRSKYNPTLGPRAQGPRYLSAPSTSTVTLSSTGATQRYFATAQSGLAAYLIANVEGVSGAALTPAQADTIAASIIEAMRAGEDLDTDALNAIVAADASVAATGVLTLSGNAANTNTVTIGSKVYTFQTALTNVDGNVLIGGSASASIDNLVAAITLGAGAGTTYAAAMTLHPTVTAAAGAGDTMDATAKTAGTAGNAIATTETLGSGVWGAVTLTGGVDVSLTGGDSTATVLDVLRILSGVTYTVPAGTIVQVVVSTFNPQADPEAFNTAGFGDGVKDILDSDGAFYISLAEGQLAGFTSSAFTYLGVTGSALVVYDNEGLVL